VPAVLEHRRGLEVPDDKMAAGIPELPVQARFIAPAAQTGIRWPAGFWMQVTALAEAWMRHRAKSMPKVQVWQLAGNVSF